MHRTHDAGTLTGRSTACIAEDARTVRWIAQAAVNVELFTIPLYMVSLYSLAGMHPITGKGNDFYQGRLWPGAKTSSDPATHGDTPGWANAQAFNIVFSVFVQEMLHLQMAANIATAIGAQPSFTQTALQDAHHGWTCYGKDLTIIPGIVDLADTDRQKDVRVAVGPLDADRIALFLAIEQPQACAEADIVRNKDRYFPKVPFAVPTGEFLFGSIGYMYQCLRDYLEIVYDDGTRLWDHVFDPASRQNDMFNYVSAVPGKAHEREYKRFGTLVTETDPARAFGEVLTMMNAITDQGEGATLKARAPAGVDREMLEAVEAIYRPDRDALVFDYPSYTDQGDPAPSADAAARFDNDGDDHYERFGEVAALIGQGGILTWADAGKAGRWSAGDLTTPDFPGDDGLPAPEQIAAAMNALYDAETSDGAAANYTLMSQAVVGAIKGVTTVLDRYWDKTDPPGFPYPSMAGSGDRMAAAWAVFGRTPDLSAGIADPDTSKVGHACQGLDLTADGANRCASVEVFHSCKGSNVCKGMAGCGFVNTASGGGGSCSAVQARAYAGLCGGPTPPATLFTAPSDNICAGFGGCAIPISACQVYPVSGEMEVMDLADGEGSKRIGTIAFAVGDRVEDVAFAAFAKVAESRGQPVPPRQPPSDIRLAFPPST